MVELNPDPKMIEPKTKERKTREDKLITSSLGVQEYQTHRSAYHPDRLSTRLLSSY